MAKSRLQKSLADYMAIAITPALIMLLVASLVFFLMEVSYSGRFETRLHWILGWFVFGSVLVSRIAIEQGSAYAGGFAALLAFAVSLAVLKFVDAYAVAFVLLIAIWWCTNKLTYDCTLIDESADSSGEGLLQIAGLSHDDDQMATADDDDQKSIPWWQRWVTNPSRDQQKPHAPGLWVVYFSLAALPIFGIGQNFISESDSQSRSYAFQLLWVYVAAAFGLLLMTSFLGLRRYLRQRRLKMPLTMAGSWVATGLTLVLTILVICLVLPRPEGAYSIAGVVDSIAETAQEAADKAFLDGDSGKGKGQRSGNADEDDKNESEDENDDDSDASDEKNKEGGKTSGRTNPTDKNRKDESDDRSKGDKSDSKDSESGGGDEGKSKSRSDDSESNKEDKGKSKSGSSKSDKKRGGDGGKKSGKRDSEKKEKKGEGTKKSDDDEDARRQENGKTPNTPKPQPSTPPSSGSWIGTAVKWLIYGVVALVVLWFAWKHRHTIIAAICDFLQAIRDFWSRLIGGSKSEETEKDESPSGPVIRPFDEFQNPFWTGSTPKVPPAELLRYTFEALQAWSASHGLVRSSDQTPMEFTEQLAVEAKPIAADVKQIGQLYGRMAYAGRKPNSACLPLLERLWQNMEQLVPADEPV